MECVISSILTYLWWKFRFKLNQGPNWQKLTKKASLRPRFFTLINIFGLKGPLSVSQNVFFSDFFKKYQYLTSILAVFHFFEFFLYILCYFEMCLQPPVFDQFV